MVTISEVATFILCIAVASIHVLNPVLDFWRLGLSPDSSVVFPVTLLALLTAAYLMGVILVYVRVSSAASVLISPAAVRQFVGLSFAMACALLLLFAMPLVPFRFLTAGW